MYLYLNMYKANYQHQAVEVGKALDVQHVNLKRRHDKMNRKGYKKRRQTDEPTGALKHERKKVIQTPLSLSLYIYISMYLYLNMYKDNYQHQAVEVGKALDVEHVSLPRNEVSLSTYIYPISILSLIYLYLYLSVSIYT